MRRFSSASLVTLAAVLFLMTLWSACGGGGNSSATNIITKYVFSPTVISLEPGQVVSVTATPYNASGTVVSATVTYTSSDSTNADISPGGLLCGGHWADTTYTVCQPGTQVGQYTITASATTSTTVTATATAYIHYHVDAVYVHGPSAVCTSMGQTAGVTAYACASKANTGGTCSTTCADNANMCDISSTVGGFNFGALDTAIATISGTTLTATAPGSTKIYAAVNSGNVTTTSTAVPYTTCLVDSIALHATGNNSQTSFSVAKSSTQGLTADVLDTAGASISPTLTFTSQQPVGTVAAGSPAVTATFSGTAPGYGSVVATCAPPGCNKNNLPVYSNVVTATVQNSSSDTGVTANETNVWVTGAGAIQMYPVDTTNFTLGTVVSLPNGPNSMVISRDGSKIYLGNDTAAMVVTTSSNSVQTLGFSGKALAVAPNNAYVLFANGSTVNIMSGSSLTIANPGGFAIPNVAAASFSPDGNVVYFTNNTNLYAYNIATSSGSTPTPLQSAGGGSPLPAAANDLTTSANGSIVFTATSPKIVADENCNLLSNNQYVASFQPLGGQSFSAPSALAALPNGTGVLAIDGTTIDEVTISSPNPLTSPFAGCPAKNFATTPGTISLSALGGNLKVNQLKVSPSGHYAAVMTGCASGGCTPQVGIIDLTKGTVTAVPLVDKGASALTQIYSGDWMIDDSGVWVGADDSYVHFVDATKLADTEDVQVQVQGPSSGGNINYVQPTFVAVQHK